MFWNANYAQLQIRDTQMEYISFGKGSKHLVLLPGLGDALTTLYGKSIPMAWAYRMYAKEYKVYLFSRIRDLPEGYTTRDMAFDQAEAMRILGIQKAAVIGVSQGGMIAQHLAICAPDLVERLILTVTTARSNEQTRNVIEGWVSMAKRNDYRSIMIDTTDKSYSQQYLRKMRFFYTFIGRFGKPKDFHRFLIQARSCIEHDSFAHLNQVGCPTLIIGGDQDQIIPVECSYELAREIPNSEIMIYKGLGHAAYEEASDFHERVMKFLTQVI
ncbi:MAG: alpha/beta hydrolase [Lachnospiraceae bacterium]|jgi:pimeloyl-ACP methyl ester carboxylesterase|nr:alpha/beta hydrolase [Lachnospiraceae bacterium]